MHVDRIDKTTDFVHMTKTSPQPFLALPPNRAGLDYFVGDIHGAFDRLQAELSRMGFRTDVDRLISVGDLIDRGPQSVAAEQWLGLPYFHAVRGNHEEMYLTWRRLGAVRAEQQRFEDEAYFRNGGAWVRDMAEMDHMALEALIERLPYVITVPALDGRLVAAVHAGFPDGSSWPQLINAPLTQDMINSFVWDRNRIRFHQGQRGSRPLWDEGIIPGLHAVVCGHVRVQRPTWAGRFLCLETRGWAPDGRFSVTPLSTILRKN